jgi:hypothetical protein
MRFLLALLVCAGAVWAEEDWEVAGTTTDQQDILEQDIEDFLDRDKYKEQGWLYDRTGIWDTLVWDLSAGYWYTSLRGPIKLGGRTVIDVTNVLGLPKSEGAPTARVQASVGAWEAIVDWYGVNYDGAQLLLEDIELPDGTIVPVGALVVTDIDISVVRTLASVRLWHKDRVFNLNFVFGINWTKLSGSITARTINSDPATARWDVILPIPVIGLAVHGQIGPLFYRVEFAGIGISLSFPDEVLDSVGGGVFDGKATVGYYFGETVSLRAGYRYTSVEAFADGIKVEFKIDGYFFEIAVTF